MRRKRKIDRESKLFEAKWPKGERRWVNKIKLVLLLAVVVGGIIGGWRLIKEQVWVGEERFNFLIVGEEENRLRPVWWVSLNQKEESGLVIYFPYEVVLEAAGGYGEYRVWALPALGELEKRGFKLLQDSMQIGLGLKIGGVLETNQLGGGVGESNGLGWLRKVVWESIIKFYQGKMSLVDRLRLLGAMQKISNRGFEFINFGDSRWAYEMKLPDGTQVVGVDKMRLDAWIQQMFHEEEIIKEGLSVGVVNYTNYSQLGTKAALMLINSSIDVVAIETGEGRYEVSKIKLGDKELKKSKTLERIKDFLPQAEVEVVDIEDERFDIVVGIGEDFGEYFGY